MASPAATSSDLPEAMTGTGTDLTRILSLSDGIFGFAMTLLIVNFAIPTFNASAGSSPGLLSYLTTLRYGLLAYAESFLIIASWWGMHHRLFGVIKRYDPMLIRLNNLFLLSISLTPFLLALVVAFGPSQLSSMDRSAKIAVSLFAVLEMCTGAIAWGIWKYVTRTPGMVDARLTRAAADQQERQSLQRVGLFAVSAAVAWVLPEVAIWIWLSILFGGGRQGGDHRRRTRRSGRSEPKGGAPLPSAPAGASASGSGSSP